ncbi:MAG: chaperone protein HtpG [marine bacterium B5-7]|nr:MAG: chaperone protein HtpG [marine bacterium B5-7]
MNKAVKHDFQAEVKQILHLMIHSLYSNKEIFLRELISNASDACDKLRFASLTDASLMEDGGELAIDVTFNTDQKTVTISDNGVGMDHDEVVSNIGTIARSGTRDFVAALSGESKKDSQLIGQFGVGFYSAFLVSRKVVLVTRKAGASASEGVRWVSEGAGEYTIESIERPERGTRITLYLKDEDKEFADYYRLRSVISKYSDHISLPIRMVTPATDSDDAEDSDKSDNTEPKIESVNRGAALWTRPRNEISEEEYNNFYTTLSYDPEPPLLTLHNRVEGKIEYTSLLFVPARAPFDMWDRERRHGLNLYVKRIFIMDDSEHLMPPYLRFVRGVIDASDLPLNVSREHLQKNPDIDRIRGGSVKKILGELKKLASNDTEKYNEFWSEFGRVVKEGVIDDAENKETISDLLRFASTRETTQKVSLKDYVARMKDRQKSVYYITADSLSAAQASPHLEIFAKNDIEVLLLHDSIDEWLVNHLTEFDGKSLKSVAKGALPEDEIENSEEADKEQHEQKSESLKGLVDALKEKLGERVKDVRLSRRLTDSPACLVADEHDLGGNLKRILEAAGQNAPDFKPILEINPDHQLISRISPDSPDLEDWAHVLLDQAALSEGAPLEEPAAYVRRINKLLATAA